MTPSLENQLSAALSKRASKSVLRRLTTAPNASIDFSSNDFLSLSTSPVVKRDFLRELETSPDFRLGSGGSRLLNGNSKYAEDLEKQIATFHNAPSALLFNSGYDANTGFFSSIPQVNDIVIYDEYIHASVREGLRLSRCSRSVSFIHNSVKDLERILKSVVSTRDGKTFEGNIFVAVESLYSMDGDLCPLQGVVDVVERLCNGRGYVAVDEAHSNGVFGEKGRGLVCQLGLERRVFARLHTMGKGIGCNGAALLCSKLTREYLINYARPLIYTTAMSFPSLAAIKVIYEMMERGDTLPLLTSLTTLTTHLHNLLLALPQTTHLTIPPHPPQSPIFSLLSPNPRSLAKHCQSRGFLVLPIVPPTVPLGTERVRVCLHAGNTTSQVEALVGSISEWIAETEEKRGSEGRSDAVEAMRTGWMEKARL